MTKLYYEKIGQGIPLVLLHGWAMHGGVWEQCISQLAESFTLYVVDLPGFGYSNKLAINDDISSLAVPIIDAIQEPAIYLGWSLGGLVATHIAANQPEKVLGLIQVCSTPKFVAEESWPGMSQGNIENFHRLLHQDYEKTIERFIMLQLYQDSKIKQRAADLKEMVLSRPKPDLNVLDSGLNLLQRVDQRKIFSEIKKPILGIFGRLDRIVLSQVACHLENCETTIFPKATHMPFITHEDEFCLQVKQFGASL